MMRKKLVLSNFLTFWALNIKISLDFCFNDIGVFN